MRLEVFTFTRGARATRAPRVKYGVFCLRMYIMCRCKNVEKKRKALKKDGMKERFFLCRR